MVECHLSKNDFNTVTSNLFEPVVYFIDHFDNFELPLIAVLQCRRKLLRCFYQFSEVHS